VTSSIAVFEAWIWEKISVHNKLVIESLKSEKDANKKLQY